MDVAAREESVTDSGWSRLLGRYPFVSLTTFDSDSGCYVHSRVPVVALRDHTSDAVVISGHVARSNEHWRTCQRAPLTLCVIDGADAYVSPSSYEKQPAVPTWNYCTATVMSTPLEN